MRIVPTGDTAMQPPVFNALIRLKVNNCFIIPNSDFYVSLKFLLEM